MIVEFARDVLDQGQLDPKQLPRTLLGVKFWRMTSGLFDDRLLHQAEMLGDLCLSGEHSVVTAESCTGGLIAALCTSVSGSSTWFVAGLVTYTLDAKQQILGVSADTLATHGAVSEPVASEMALAALRRSPATLSVSVTGVAGPGGGDVSHPVGTVWFGWARKTGQEIQLMQTSRHQLHGDRGEVRSGATRVAMNGLIKLLQ
jgi:nicotinamide-nucleotide amidase